MTPLRKTVARANKSRALTGQTKTIDKALASLADVGPGFPSKRLCKTGTMRRGRRIVPASHSQCAFPPSHGHNLTRSSETNSPSKPASSPRKLGEDAPKPYNVGAPPALIQKRKHGGGHNHLTAKLKRPGHHSRPTPKSRTQRHRIPKSRLCEFPFPIARGSAPAFT